jgi:hypothetical protein
MSCRTRLNGPSTGPDRAELNGSCRTRPTGCRPGPSTAWLVLRAGSGPLPFVPGHARAGPNHVGRGPAHLPRPNFQDYYQGRTCPTKDCTVALEYDVNIRWCRTCSTRPNPLANLRRKITDVLTFIFPSKYFGKRFTNMENSSGITCFP